MGLVDEYVEIKLSNNTKYWENLNYEIPRYYDKRGRLKIKQGTKIKVKTSDLPKGSHTKVRVICDNKDCKNQYDIPYKDYIKQLHNGKIYCCKCANAILNSGENHWHWNFNKTDKEREIQRCYPEYTEFVKKVLTRDGYTCQCCNKHYSYMFVHHLDGYDWCEEKRTDETNGITLCENCHDNFHSIYGRGNNTKEQFEEWIGHTLGELKKYNGELPIARKVYCIEEDKIYNSAKEIGKLWNYKSYTNIYDVCNKKVYKCIKGKHLLWYDEYLKMSKEDIKEYISKFKNRGKLIICITTRKLFRSVHEGISFYNCKVNYRNNCNKIKSFGKLEDGTKLQWKYIDDLTEEEYIKYDIENELKELYKII